MTSGKSRTLETPNEVPLSPPQGSRLPRRRASVVDEAGLGAQVAGADAPAAASGSGRGRVSAALREPEERVVLNRREG